MIHTRSCSHAPRAASALRLPRPAGLAASALLALGASLSAQAPAFPGAPLRNTTGLLQHGQVDPTNGFPIWYEDRSGVRLGQCTDPANCLFVLPDGAQPAVYPTNWPNELFYWTATATAVGTGTNALVFAAALEGAYANGALVAGEEILFTRIRFRANGLLPLATYRVTHPYGVEIVTADALGVASLTRDVLGPVGDFATALHGDVGPFLLPQFSTTPLLPGSYLGDGVTPTAVQGSPFGTDFVRIEGPGVGTSFPAFVQPDATLGPDPTTTTDAIELRDFVLTGQASATTGLALDKAVVTKDPTRTAVDVWATAATGQQVQASVDGSLWIDLAERGTSGAFYARLELGRAAPRPTRVDLRNLSDTPTTLRSYSIAAQGQSVLADAVCVRSAVFTIGGDLRIEASSSEAAAGPVLTPIVEGVAKAPLVRSAAAPNGFAGAAGLPVGTPPPATVTVRSSLGGEVTVPVCIEGTGFVGVPRPPITADAGADLTVTSGQRAALSGLASVGPITSWTWSHNGPADFVLENADTATPAFTAPAIRGTALDVLVTLRVQDGLGSVANDTMLVHIANPTPLDALAITSASFSVAARAWTIAGTATLRQGQTITIYLGAQGDTSQPIARVTSSATGSWTFVGARGSATASGAVPTTGATTIWAQSSLAGIPAVARFRVQ